MRKHGWQLPYHPLQVVAVAVFLALGFAFYVFFAPFVGKKMLQYIVMGLYTPLITCCFGLYIWCAAADPADPGVFKSKKYHEIPESGKPSTVMTQKESKLAGENPLDGNNNDNDAMDKDENYPKASITDDTKKKVNTSSSPRNNPFRFLCAPCAYACNCSGSSRDSSLQMSEEGMFYCSLCEVEVFKYSKHCRVCDKCVDSFDHHCRWLNNCIGKRNYRQFFTLMVSAILLLILQWTTGLFVLVCCFIERKRFSADIATNLGSSFSLVPFVLVVALCTLLAMIATLPLAQLFFFHILLIKKGISTYDYIIALREQENDQQGLAGQQSPQMSQASSLTAMSSASSFSNFHRGAAWCTPPRLFLEDQFDVVAPDTASVSSLGKKAGPTSTSATKKKNPSAVKISPWALARLNAEEISKAAAEARKKSKILQPVSAHRGAFPSHDSDAAAAAFGRRPDNARRRPPGSGSGGSNSSKRVRLPAELPKGLPSASSSSAGGLAPLQLEARSAFQAAAASSSSPESSLESPDIHPFGASEEARRRPPLPGFPLSRSTSDGYEASGGEDSDRVTTRFAQRSTNWSNGLFGSEEPVEHRLFRPTKASSSSADHHRRL